MLLSNVYDYNATLGLWCGSVRHLGGDPLAIQVIRWLQHQRGVEKAPSIGLILRGAAWCGALRGGALPGAALCGAGRCCCARYRQWTRRGAHPLSLWYTLIL